MKLFRKNRFLNLSKGESKKYIQYAVGEIVLVVLGILIALQINNWNEDKKEAKILRDHLIKIKSHTKEDLKMLDSLTLYRTNTSEICKNARASILNKKYEEQSTLLMYCGGAFVDYRFKSNSDGYDALKNSKQFGKINNTLLDSLLTRYHRLVDDISQNEKSYNGYLNSQENYLSREFDRSLILALAFMPMDSVDKWATPRSEYYKDIRKYTSLTSYRNVVNLASYQFDWIIKQYNQLNAIGKQVIEEVNIVAKD